MVTTEMSYSALASVSELCHIPELLSLYLVSSYCTPALLTLEPMSRAGSSLTRCEIRRRAREAVGDLGEEASRSRRHSVFLGVCDG